MNPPVFEVKNVSFGYQDQVALNNCSLQIPHGQRIALLGANGSGKSTLLRLLNALYFADQGEIKAFGAPLSETAMMEDAVNFAFRQKVGFVFQNPDVQLFNPTVFDEIAFGPLQMGWPKEKILSAIDASLDRFGISHLKHRAPHQLSGGEKKRVALASILILEPEVVLLDEPTAALDPASQSDVIRFLIECRNSGRTIITATHDLDIIEDIADYAFVLAAGQVVAEGTPAQILANTLLLQETHLAHAHWHVHADGKIHQHQHIHHHNHEHLTPGTRYRSFKSR